MSRYGETTLYRQVRCMWGGPPLEHKADGRNREYCSDKCRVYRNRAEKRYARACVDAALAGQPEPARDFGYPVEMSRYRVSSNGAVTKC